MAVMAVITPMLPEAENCQITKRLEAATMDLSVCKIRV